MTDKINEKINVMLTEKCPSAPMLMGRPSSHKASQIGSNGKVKKVRSDSFPFSL